MWEGWKGGMFKSLDTDAMEEGAQKFQKRLMKLGKELRTWKLFGAMKEKVEQFKKALPLIQDLRNDALRDRHWQQLMDIVGQPFDPHADSFTLEKIFNLGLQNFEEDIGSISTAASK